MFQAEWLPQAAALEVLGISRTQVWRLRRAGVIHPVHLYRSGPGPRARLWMNVAAIRLALQVQMQAQEAQRERVGR